MGLEVIPHDERVFTDLWESLTIPGLVNTTCGHLSEYFYDDQIDMGESRVVLCGADDVGVHLQRDAHPNEDLIKAVRWGVNWDSVSSARDRYVNLNVVVGDFGRCDPAHEYVCKTDRYTFCTFPRVPDWVSRWFCCNLNVSHPKASWIPFGLNGEKDRLVSRYIDTFAGRPKDRLLYVNFSNHTYERAALKARYAGEGWATYRETPTIPIGSYIQEMSRHRFVLCPAGNGLDCYRTYEALYLGCIPILKDGVFARHMVDAKLPVLACTDLAQLTPRLLDDVYEKFLSHDYAYEKLTRSYWVKAIKDAAPALPA